MDGMKLHKTLKKMMAEHWYLFVLITIGLIMMLLPAKKTQTHEIEEVVVPACRMEEQLEAILSQIQGAGSVKVMLTEREGEKVVYQTDIHTDMGENTRTETEDTVTVSDTERNQTGLIKQVIPANYLGAVVVASGADSPMVRLAIIEAVSDLTGLGADHISVLKMK